MIHPMSEVFIERIKVCYLICTEDMANTSCLMAKSRWNLHLITWSILVKLVEFIIYLKLLKKWENTSYNCEVFSSHCLIFKLCNYNWHIPKSRMVFPFNPTQQSKSRIIFKHHENTMTMWCFKKNKTSLAVFFRAKGPKKYGNCKIIVASK